MRRIIVLAGGLLVVLILLVAQLVLPGIAAQRLRDRLSHSGRVLSVQVSAFPAIELLWHRADRVVVRMATYTSTVGALERDVGEVADTGSLDATAGVLHSGLLTIHHASLRKRGDRLVGRATVTESDLRASLPILDAVTPVDSTGGQLTLQGTGTFLGVSATVDATVRPLAGALVVAPDVPFGGLATITLFASPHVNVESITASPASGGFTTVVGGRLR